MHTALLKSLCIAPSDLDEVLTIRKIIVEVQKKKKKNIYIYIYIYIYINWLITCSLCKMSLPQNLSALVQHKNNNLYLLTWFGK